MPKITDLKQLITHIKKAKQSKLSIADAQNLRGLASCEKQQGFTNCDDGIFRWNTGKVIGKNVILIKGYGNILLFFIAQY